MKDIARILTIALVAMLPLGCVREPAPDANEGGSGIALTFRCTDLKTKSGTNGVRDGENNWNENLISTLDLFFYPEEGTGSDCVLHQHFTPNESDGDATVTTYTTDEFVTGTLVPTSRTSFWVYAVANYPGTMIEDELDLSGTSVEELKAMSLNCNFSAVIDAQHPHRQNSFVMDGLAQVTGVEKENRLVAKGFVNLRRVASKITVQLAIASQVSVPRTREENEVMIDYEEHWEPMISGLQMYIENAVRNTTIGAKPVDNPIYFSYTGNRMYFTRSSDPGDAQYPYVTDPTYVYPQRWEYASKESPTKEPTLKLILPWRRLEDSENHVTATQKQFYYKIIIPDDPRPAVADTTYLRNFVRNNWYHFKMNVAMLGSETDEAAVLVEGKYYVVNWQDKDVVVKEAVIGAARFLSMEPKEYTLNNVPDLDMLYTSSHPVALNTTKGGTVLDITATRVYYGKQNAGTSYAGGTIRTAGANHADYENGQKYIEYSAAQRAALNNGSDWLRVDGEYIKFYHELNNDLSAGTSLDTSPYIVRFNMYHADHYDDAVYKQSIKITQMPALFVTAEVSNGYVFVNGTGPGATGTGTTNVTDLGSIVGRGSINDSGDNTNPRQYTVKVTVLPSDSEYIIGDPRTDGSEAIVTNVSGINDNGNYRPASTDARYIIAPEVRIASSYGKTSNLNYEAARARCASYQENGYPAGRWRLPTMAEVRYLITLSDNEIIPVLFTSGAMNTGGYTCADGVVFPIGNNQIEYRTTAEAESIHNGLHFPRCVYDIWYWGDDKDSDHMTSWSGFQTAD